jgi:hypothetical protein
MKCNKNLNFINVKVGVAGSIPASAMAVDAKMNLQGTKKGQF